MIWLLVGCSLFGTEPSQVNELGGCWDSSPSSCPTTGDCYAEACQACVEACGTACHPDVCDTGMGSWGCPTTGEIVQNKDYCPRDSG